MRVKDIPIGATVVIPHPQGYYNSRERAAARRTFALGEVTATAALPQERWMGEGPVALADDDPVPRDHRVLGVFVQSTRAYDEGTWSDFRDIEPIYVPAGRVFAIWSDAEAANVAALHQKRVAKEEALTAARAALASDQADMVRRVTAILGEDIPHVVRAGYGFDISLAAFTKAVEDAYRAGETAARHTGQ